MQFKKKLLKIFMIKKIKHLIIETLYSKNLFINTLRYFFFDCKKLKARAVTGKMKKSYLKKNKTLPKRLHLGCGRRKIQGWLNVDISNSDINIDLTNKNLPFPSDFFEVIVSQHVIEHLDLKYELEPLLKELNRVLNSKGSLFLSCPSITKICESYIKDGCKTLVDGRKKRFPSWSLKGYPNVQIINELFHQGTEHKNLFDFELLSFSLFKCGFTKVEEIDEKIFLSKYKSFPKRLDDEQTLYIVAYK